MITSICNKCGEMIGSEITVENNTVRLNFDDYESTFDGQVWEFVLCDKCLLEIAKSFKHKPKGFMKLPHQEYWDTWDKLRIM